MTVCPNAAPGQIVQIQRRLPVLRLAIMLLFVLTTGCGMTRMTDTQRTATEQLLIANAVDQAVSHIDFGPLAGKSVYLDTQYLDGTVDKGYLVSSLRQSLLASGCILKEDRTKAIYLVEARAGCVGTDRHSLLVGVPQMTVPAFVPGQPSQIPEIPFAKKTDEQGYAKLAVFAYNRITGQRVWQSGTTEASSDAKDLWLLGLGPFRKGTILTGTELAGEEIPNPLGKDHAHASQSPPLVPPTCSASWPEPPRTGLTALVDLLTGAALGDLLKLGTNSPPAVAGNASEPPKPGPSLAANTGGHEETEPNKILNSGLHFKADRFSDEPPAPSGGH